jgi:kinetochore protein NDC80
MDRRKTLAGLSPAQLNSRASLAPGRGMAAKGGVAVAAAKLPLEKALSRMSLAGPVARRSSAYTTKGNGVKSDPRPVSDKGFQAACIRTVIAYLAARGFEFAISPKASWCCLSAKQLCEAVSCHLQRGKYTVCCKLLLNCCCSLHLNTACPLLCLLQVLASPTTKDFTNVMLFLYRQLDPVLPKAFKLEEEVGMYCDGSCCFQF